MLTSTTWPVGTRVRLLSVPWDASYRDVVAWESADKRDEWFESQSGAWFASNFQNLRPGEPVDVPVPYSSVYKYNYIVVTNPQQPVTDEGPERTYFYFVTSAQYLSPQATRLTVQLDVMTTYAGAIKYGRAFVECGHVGVANSNLSNSTSTLNGEQLSKYADIPEGLDVGSALITCGREYVPVLGNDTETNGRIIVVSTADLAANPGTEASPSLNVADGQFADGLPSGCNVYWVDATLFKAFFDKLKDKSWVAQCIVSIYAFPGRLLTAGPSVKLFGQYEVGMHFLGNTASLDDQTGPYYRTGNVFEKLAQGIPDIYKPYTKLLGYPYSVIELAGFTGNPIFLKPQFIRGNRLEFWWIGCALAPFAKVGFFPKWYGSNATAATEDLHYAYTSFDPSNGNVTGTIPAGDFLDTCLWITDFPQFSIVNNNYLTYMASTVHSRNYSYQSAGWQQSRTNMQATAGYENAMQQAGASMADSIEVAQQQIQNSDRSYGANIASTGIGLAGGLADMAVGANYHWNQGSTVNPSGAFGMGASAISNLVQADAMHENQVGMAGAYQVNAFRDYGAASAIADRNRGLASSVAQGDYQNEIAGINAKVQDAALTPPSTVGQAGGEGFNWKNGLVGFTVTYKTLGPSAAASVGDYFARYGYQVHRFLPLGTVRQMLCMSHFAYWKAKETNLTCAKANETERETMRGVIEKGVTLWGAPEYIGNTPVTDNQPLDGYSY